MTLSYWSGWKEAPTPQNLAPTLGVLIPVSGRVYGGVGRSYGRPSLPVTSSQKSGETLMRESYLRESPRWGILVASQAARNQARRDAARFTMSRPASLGCGDCECGGDCGLGKFSLKKLAPKNIVKKLVPKKIAKKATKLGKSFVTNTKIVTAGTLSAVGLKSSTQKMFKLTDKQMKAANKVGGGIKVAAAIAATVYAGPTAWTMLKAAGSKLASSSIGKTLLFKAGKTIIARKTTASGVVDSPISALDAASLLAANSATVDTSTQSSGLMSTIQDAVSSALTSGQVSVPESALAAQGVSQAAYEGTPTATGSEITEASAADGGLSGKKIFGVPAAYVLGGAFSVLVYLSTKKGKK